MSFKITFLGTGGGRHSAMYQTRCTGGMLVEHDGHFLHIDPGPGALTQMKNIHYDPADTDSIIISHAHPDHYTDAEVAIEGMTRGGWTKRGHIYGSVTVMEGQGGLGPCLSQYHMNIAASATVFRPGDVLDIDGLRTEICYADHSDPTNVGFRFITDDGIVSYVSDTQYSDELADQYIGSRVLILPVTAPDDSHIKYHLCTADATKFIKRVSPELTIFIHLGIVMIFRGPKEQADVAEAESGCKVIAGEDLMTVEMGKTILLGKAKTFTGTWFPPSAPLTHH
ncbi:MAG: MBL fold metallo-hydrolase [Candidatus Methanomethylophilaceae archaeon]